MIDRVVDTITAWGSRTAISSTTTEAAAFSDELKHLIVEQKAAFNSPVWFNIGVKGVPQQASACFILAVDDSMSLDPQLVRRGGHDLQGRLRLRRQPLEHPVAHESCSQGGGTASGPVSFMRGADASAGTIKSGGKTRRAAKMVILDADHPDIQRVHLVQGQGGAQGTGAWRRLASTWTSTASDSHSIQYQNANNSVRVTDEFMQAVLDDERLGPRRPGPGEVDRDGEGP